MTGDELLSEDLLENVTEDEVREVFKLHPDAYPGDCLIVEEEHLDWLARHGHPELDLDTYTYFVEFVQ